MRGNWPSDDGFNTQYDHMISYLDECDEPPRLLGIRIDNDVYGQVFLGVALYALSCLFGDLASLKDAVDSLSTILDNPASHVKQ